MRFEPRKPREGVNYGEGRPLLDAALLFLALCAILAVFVVGAGWLVDWLAPRTPPEWETRVFAPLWDQDSFGSAPADGPARERLQSLVDELAAHWPENPYELRVVVLDEEQPNAFALPGGLVAFTTGLLEQAESENEIAFVVSHELGHFHNRDHLRSIGRAVVVRGAAAAVSWATGSAMPSLEWLETLASRSFSRGQERAADRFGLELTYARYGHLAGADDFFERSASERSSARWAAFLSTHPADADRISGVAAYADERRWALSGGLAPKPLAFAGDR